MAEAMGTREAGIRDCGEADAALLEGLGYMWVQVMVVASFSKALTLTLTPTLTLSLTLSLTLNVLFF